MKAQRYRITVREVLDGSWAAYFAGMAMSKAPAGGTRLCGEVADQPALHGLLHRVRDLNLTLVSVQLLDCDGVTPVDCRRCRGNKPPNTPFDR